MYGSKESGREGSGTKMSQEKRSCYEAIKENEKMSQRRDNDGAVCNYGMGMLFLCIYLFYIISLGGDVEFFLMRDA